MKKIIILVITLLAFAVVAIAGTIEPTGINQGDLYSLLNKVVTLVNEIKTQHNSVVVTKRAAFGTYSSQIKVLNVTGGNLSLTQ